MKKGMIITNVLVLMGFCVSVGVYADNFTQPIMTMQDEVTYDEISVDELPQEVNDAVAQSYADYTVSAAHLGSIGISQRSLPERKPGTGNEFRISGRDHLPVRFLIRSGIYFRHLNIGDQ